MINLSNIRITEIQQISPIYRTAKAHIENSVWDQDVKLGIINSYHEDPLMISSKNMQPMLNSFKATITKRCPLMSIITK